MSYFAFLARQSFKTAPDGTRLFYTSGPWSRAFIIPDDETEQRLFRKQLWIMRIMVGSMIAGMPVLFAMFPQVTKQTLPFFAFLAAMMAMSQIAHLIVFADDRRTLARAAARQSMRSFFSDNARKHSRLVLWSGTLGSLLLAAGGVFGLIDGGTSKGAAIFAMVFFGLCTVAWGYALVLKRTQPAAQ